MERIFPIEGVEPTGPYYFYVPEDQKTVLCQRTGPLESGSLQTG